MSRKSKLVSRLSITPGQQVVKTMSTGNADGNAAALLREIAKNCTGMRTSRAFSDWREDEGVLVSSGTVVFGGGRHFSLTVKIGVPDDDDPETLVLLDVSGSECSMQPVNGKMVLGVGSKIQPKRIESLANQMTGVWVVHGKHWLDRSGTKFQHPWGATKRGTFETFDFEVIDGSLESPPPTLGELISRGGRRSTHVGEWWQRHSTIIPAIVGMPMTMHEFKKDGGEDICSFNGVQIGLNPAIWGPYCHWNEDVRHSEGLGMWRDLALNCATPFNFHVHATRTLFPSIQLDSDYLLQTVGSEKLRGMLAVMVENQPGRFYRLIDERGVTHRQTSVSDTECRYGDYGCFPRSRMTENVIGTLLELQALQNDAGRALVIKPRLVIDSHAYIVIEAMARGQRDVYELSGRDMHKYLTDGSDAKMHRIRNEELFGLLKRFFGIERLRFHIYPPLTYLSGVNSQYDDNLKHCRPQEWLQKPVK
jgi:hypothetical protein